MGVISHAKGLDDIAKRYFEKAVYLDSKHYQALTYLALLAENQKDKKKAAILRNRAERCFL